MKLKIYELAQQWETKQILENLWKIYGHEANFEDMLLND